MDTDWIEAVMRMNDQIVQAEARLQGQADKLFQMLLQGQDTVEDEGLLVSYGHRVVLLRAAQAQLLRMEKDRR